MYNLHAIFSHYLVFHQRNIYIYISAVNKELCSNVRPIHFVFKLLTFRCCVINEAFEHLYICIHICQFGIAFETAHVRFGSCCIYFVGTQYFMWNTNWHLNTSFIFLLKIARYFAIFGLGCTRHFRTMHHFLYVLGFAFLLFYNL